MTAPFEDPAKTQLVGRARVAIEKLGQVLIDPPEPIDLPGHAARLKGDAQSSDSSDRKRSYFCVPYAARVLPGWIATYARSARELENVGVYVVLDGAAYDPEIEASSKAAGAGLLVVTQDDDFDVKFDFFAILPAELAAAFAEAVFQARRSLDARLDNERAAITQRREVIVELTAQMDDAKAERYRAALEADSQRVSEWAEGLAEQLDKVTATMDAGALDAVRDAIAAGPVLEGAGE